MLPPNVRDVLRRAAEAERSFQAQTSQESWLAYPLSSAASEAQAEDEGLFLVTDAGSRSGYWGVAYEGPLCPTPYSIDLRPFGGSGHERFPSAQAAALALQRQLRDMRRRAPAAPPLSSPSSERGEAGVALYPKPRGRVPKSKASGLEMAWCGRTGAWMEPRAGHAVDTPSADAEEEEAEAAADEVEEVSDGSSLHTYDGPASTESDDESQPPPPPPPPPPAAAGRVYLCRLCGVPKRGHKCAPAGAAEPAGQEEERSRPPPRLKASFLAGYHSEGKLLKGMSLY